MRLYGGPIFVLSSELDFYPILMFNRATHNFIILLKVILALMSTREFENLLIKWEINEREEQTIVSHLSGLEPKYANVVELQ